MLGRTEKNPIRILFLDDNIWKALDLKNNADKWTKNCRVPCRIRLQNSLDPFAPTCPYQTPDDEKNAEVVLSTGWMNWEYTQLVKDTSRLRENHNDTPLKQLLGVINVSDEMIRQPVDEDLSKIDLYIHTSRYSDIVISNGIVIPDFPPEDYVYGMHNSKKTKLLPVESALKITSDDRGKLPKFADKNDYVAPIALLGFPGEANSCKNAGKSWWLPYVKELSKHIQIDVHDSECFPEGKAPESFISHETLNFLKNPSFPYRFVFVFEDSLLADYASYRLWESALETKNAIILYLGHSSLIDKFPAVKNAPVMQVTFPSPRYYDALLKMNVTNAPQDSTIRLPSSNLISLFSFPGGPTQMADYIDFLSRNEKAYQTHFLWRLPNRGVCEEFVHGLSSALGQSNPIGGPPQKENWICEVCEYYHLRHDFKKR